MLDRQRAQLGLKPLARLEPGRTPGQALRAVLVGGERPQFLQQIDGAACVNRLYQSAYTASGSCAYCGVALQHASAAGIADEFAVAHLHLPAHRDHSRPAFNRQAFKTVVVVVGVLRRGGDGAAILGIVDHEIGVAADGDGSLAREKAEELGGARAQRIHKAMQIEPAALHAVGVHQVHAILNAGNAVGNLREGFRRPAASARCRRDNGPCRRCRSGPPASAVHSAG